jgi:hypothetical protein
MDNSFIELERKFCNNYSEIPGELKSLYKSLCENNDITLNTTTFSEAILLRLISYYSYQNEIKDFLNKRYVTPGADFFVETVLFYLKFIIEKYAPEFNVYSERAIERKRGAIRPDISIWKGEEVIAIVECKTQLGWNRVKWEEDFIKREAKLGEKFPNAKAYLLVMSLANWEGFGDSIYLGNKYFVLSKYWPGDLKNIQDDAIETPIENLFKKVIYN